MFRQCFEEILEGLEEACADHYGDRLVSAAVFGSVARGTMRPDSDIDLLLVIDRLPNGCMPRMNEFAALEARLAPLLAAAAERGVSATISPVFKTPQELGIGSPLFFDMTEAVLMLCDAKGLLRGYLEGLRGRMQALGSRRIEKGGGCYWLLKPGLKPGEDFTL